MFHLLFLPVHEPIVDFLNTLVKFKKKSVIKKYLIIFLVTFYSFSQVGLAQVDGGHVEVTQIASNQFLVEVKVIADCADTNLPDSLGFSSFSSQARIFDSGNDTLLAIINSGKLDSVSQLNYSDSCYTIPGFCGKAYHYSALVSLPATSQGYYFTWKLANKRPVSNLIGNTDLVYYAQFSLSLTGGNNSLPQFSYRPSLSYGCINYSQTLDFSCTESDGDSLVYSLVEPISDFDVSGSKPFYTGSYLPSFSQPLGVASTFNLDSKTGLVSFRFSQLGFYSLSVKCEEYRGGQKISEVTKVITFLALNCNFGLPLEFTDFPTNYTFQYGEKNCVDIAATSVSGNKFIQLSASSVAQQYGLELTLPPPNSVNNYNFQWATIPGKMDTLNNVKVEKLAPNLFQGKGRVGAQLCWDLTGCQRFPNQRVNVDLQITKERCGGLKDTAIKQVTINLIEPEINEIYSQVLSPNGDGIQDVFKLPEVNTECFSFGRASIYALSGQLVFETSQKDVYWNGTDFNGKLLSSGVYLVRVDGNYGNSPYSQSYKVLLIR